MIDNGLKIVLCTVPQGAAPQNMLRERIADEIPMAPNIAIVSLMESMEEAGFIGECYNIDLMLPSDNEIYEYFNAIKPDVVGLSAVTSAMYIKVKEISRIIRHASSSTLIVLGGNLAVSASVILNKTDVDICVLGDGEITWVNILEKLKAVGSKLRHCDLIGINGVAFLNDVGEMEFTGYGEPIPPERNPITDYNLLCSDSIQLAKTYYFKEGKKCSWFIDDERSFYPLRSPNLAMIWTNKGCVAKCTFCQRFIKGYQLFSLEKLEHHISELKTIYDVGFIFINGENFGLPKEYAYGVAKIMHKYGMLWGVGAARCNSFNLDDLKFFKECGCTAIKFGIESGSQKILDIMEKKFKVEDVFNALENAKLAGLFSPIAICIGMPGENNQTIIETAIFLGRVAQMLGIPPTRLPLQMFYALPLPGAPLYEYARLKGIFINNLDAEEEVLIHLDSKGPSSDNYINLNGARMKDAIFWEYLIRLEATRFFNMHSSNKSIISEKQSVSKVQAKDAEISKGTVLGKIVMLKWKEFFQMPEKTRFLVNRILGNETLSLLCLRIPPAILYTILREMIYIEYVIKQINKKIKRIMNNTLDIKHEFKYKRCKDRIEGSMSLRVINKELKKIQSPPLTLTEKNQRVLYEGR